METGIHELTAGYAVDALDPEERERYEAHLRECERCQAELAALWNVTDALAVATSGPAPSPDLRSRILAAARAEPHVVVPFEPSQRRRLPVLAIAAAVAAVAAIVVGAWAIRLSSQLQDTRSALTRERGTAAVLADPRSQTIALAAGEGRLVVSPAGDAVLVVTGLGPAPPGKAYETWVIRGSSVAPAGLFPGREGTNVVEVGRPVVSGDVVAVTVERAGGVSAPTRQPVVASERI